jgi:hypothetical protein
MTDTVGLYILQGGTGQAWLHQSNFLSDIVEAGRRSKAHWICFHTKQIRTLAEVIFQQPQALKKQDPYHNVLVHMCQFFFLDNMTNSSVR